MYIKNITLLNYRNYEEVNIDLDAGINILFGDNAQGKTNLLESIYVCMTTKSHRASKDAELVRFKEDEAHIRMFFEKGGFTNRIDMHIKRKGKKGIAINKIPIKKVSELFEVSNVVIFSPEDLSILKSGPQIRRKFIDIELCQLDKMYLSNLANYQKILIQRNNILKDYYIKPNYEELLDVIDLQLVNYAIPIIKERRNFIEKLNEIAKVEHFNISGKKENLEIFYEYNIHEDEMLKKLKANRDIELKRKVTLCGPHRDDMGFSINHINARHFGSQGQQRTAALSLKLAEIKLIKEKSNDNPILLLDDVLSELDINRQNYLLKNLENAQTIITCTGVDEFIKRRISINKIFKIENGTVSEIKQ